MMKFVSAFALAAAVVFTATTSFAAEATAFALIKEGNKYLGEQSKNKVVEIRSEKSIAGLVPNVWYIVYYDPDTTLKTQEIKFGAGRKIDQRRPWRLLEQVTGDKVMAPEKLKIDSNEAIKISTQEPLLEKLKLLATQLSIKRGDDENPTWKVRIWAQKLRDPSRDADIGEIYVDAKTGKVTRTDLHINRVD